MKIAATSRSVEIACYAVGAMLIVLYLSTRAYAEFERREGVAIFTEARGADEGMMIGRE